jgi:sugar/nucleoside kinase (ribokinase family)
MTDFHVYGLGNALVDTEYEIHDDFLAEQAIPKGGMTLIDHSIREDLALQLSRDFDVKKHSGGGSAANTMVAIAQFGGKAFYSCRVAEDHIGTLFHEDLQRIGVEVGTSGASGGATGQCLVMITPDAERTMLTCLGASQHLSVGDLTPDALRRSRYLYIEGYLASSPSAMEAALEAKSIARSASVPVALTLSDSAMVTHFRSQVDALLEGGVDMLFCNREEALSFSGANDLADAASYLKSRAGSFAITLGAEGALVYDGDAIYHTKPVQTRAINSNGAGDMFAGAFLYAITEGHGFAKAARLANGAAAHLVGQFGARLTREQQEALLAALLR